MHLAKFIGISVRAALLLLVFFLILINPTCKDPFDFRPDDSLVPPPAAPQLLSPIDSFVRMLGGSSSNHILLIWEAVKDAEIYEIRLDGDSVPGWTIQYDTNALNMRIDYEGGFLLDKFTWKVRAGSTKWVYYTDWSEPRRFEIRWRPWPPELIEPPDNAIIVYDSLPIAVVMAWTKVQDERYYDVNILIDSLPYGQVSVATNSFTFVVESPGTYYWQVRAGSPYWELCTCWTIPRKLLVIKLPQSP